MLPIFKFLNRPYAVIIVTVIFACGLFSVFVGGAVPVILKSYEDKNKEKVVKYLEETDRTVIDVLRSLDRLNAEKFEPCGDDMLGHMRSAQFEATFIKDVGYLDKGRLICTSGLGRLADNVPEGTPNLVTPFDYSMWLNVPIKLFNFERTANIIKKGHYNAVFNISSIEKNEIERRGLTVYIIRKNLPPYFYAGDKKLSLPCFNNKANYDMNGITTVMCSQYSPFCVADSVSYTYIIKKEHSIIFGILMLSLLSSIFISRYVYDRLKQLRGFRNRFRYGITKERVLCYYQPIVEIDTGIIIGCEVLCRWVDHDGRVVTPDKFLGYIKEMNMTYEFTRIVVDKTFEELADVIRDNRFLKISFNIFPGDFRYDKILGLVGKYRRLYPDITINLELTEDELVEISRVSKDVELLHEDGFMISIDDFGTGYSSLAYLRDIQADFIKIDRSFVKEIEHGSIKSNLIPNIVSIANDVGSQVIAEGIEKTEQTEYLKKFNVRYGQGYLYSRPCPIVDFRGLFCDGKLC